MNICYSQEPILHRIFGAKFNSTLELANYIASKGHVTYVTGHFQQRVKFYTEILLEDRVLLYALSGEW